MILLISLSIKAITVCVYIWYSLLGVRFCATWQLINCTSSVRLHQKTHGNYYHAEINITYISACDLQLRVTMTYICMSLKLWCKIFNPHVPLMLWRNQDHWMGSWVITDKNTLFLYEGMLTPLSTTGWIHHWCEPLSCTFWLCTEAELALQWVCFLDMILDDFATNFPISRPAQSKNMAFIL